ncbi:hypothetical protein [Novipirellula artificiosorum]|uniref:Uncharacterized protein n=1 Tax=Novipirellula artificiosorum TaxID=2528016 RepID=A0A5C6DC72_9BACT|nr:hypothetical protein [Novipirellula artificiosorum]TWU32816.1 hypothetical protein Poly41_51930 [Novipirellula artificiosorum]
MSTLPSTEPAKSRKQPASVYTVMLLLSVIFLLIAVIAMFVELGRWAPDYYRTNSAQPGAMVVHTDNTQFM